MTRACRHIQSLIPAIIDGEVDESIRSSARGHAEACVECDEAFEWQSRIRAAINASVTSAPSNLYFEGVLQEIHRKVVLRPSAMKPRRGPCFNRQFVATAWAASMAAVWLIAAVIPTWPPGGHWMKSGGTRAMSQVADGWTFERPHAASPRRLAESMVWVRGLGMVAADSEILRFPPGMLEELGLIPWRERKA